jgi:hypothetical protein
LLWISGWTFHRTRFFYFQINKKTYFFLLSVFSFVLIFFFDPDFFFQMMIGAWTGRFPRLCVGEGREKICFFPTGSH